MRTLLFYCDIGLALVPEVEVDEAVMLRRGKAPSRRSGPRTLRFPSAAVGYGSYNASSSQACAIHSLCTPSHHLLPRASAKLVGIVSSDQHCVTVGRCIEANNRDKVSPYRTNVTSTMSQSFQRSINIQTGKSKLIVFFIDMCSAACVLLHTALRKILPPLRSG